MLHYIYMSSTRKVNNYDDYVIEQNANLKTNQ